MTKKDICVIIPIYNESINKYEEISINQCLTILKDYKIFFIHPEKLSTDYFNNKFPNVKFKQFNNNFFKNIQGYNQLMFSSVFYNSFKEYEYMLIYQTDAYVFKDELLYWCQKGFDYIGGIWFENYSNNPYKGSKIWEAGNGGFSIRKISSFRNFMNSFIFKEFYLKYLCVLLFQKIYPNKKIGIKNNLFYLLNKDKANEDSCIVNILCKNFRLISMPSAKDVILFSWDTHPDYLYSKIKELPFGCHAWYRKDFPYGNNYDFWKNHIFIK